MIGGARRRDAAAANHDAELFANAVERAALASQAIGRVGQLDRIQAQTQLARAGGPGLLGAADLELPIQELLDSWGSDA